MMKIRNIVFDFDGTLADTEPLIVAVMQATVTELGLEPRDAREMRATIGLRLEDVPAALWPGQQIDALGYASTYRRIFDERKAELVVHCFAGVEETIKRLHEAGIGMAIATSRSRSSLEEYLNRLGIMEYFDMTVGGGDVSRGKPAPEPVEKILQAMNWKAEETLTIGDAPVDIAMGRSAGTQTCAVTYGNGSRESLLAAHPDYIIDVFTDLIPQII